MRRFGPPPSADEIEAIARAAMRRLPEPFASHLHGVVLQVEEFADAQTLAEFGMENPFELTGLYSGRPLTERSVEESGALPDRVLLYRRPILDEWAERGDVSLGALVRNVVIHEFAHHFGWSDEDIARIDRWWE